MAFQALVVCYSLIGTSTYVFFTLITRVYVNIPTRLGVISQCAIQQSAFITLYQCHYNKGLSIDSQY